jgi:MFS family permease
VASENQKIAGVRRNVFSTGLVSFFMDASSEMIYPLVPIFLSTILGVNTTVIGLIEGVAESTASVLKAFSGWFSDRIQKRKVLMLFGYGISTMSRPLVAMSTVWGHVLAFRFVDRFGKGIRGAPRDAIIAESTPQMELGRSFGFHRGMDTLGAVVGPAIAFFLLAVFKDNFRLVFWFSMIPGLIAVAIIVFFIKDTGGAGRRVKIEVSLKDFKWRYIAFVSVVTLFSIGNSSDVFLILRATDIGINKVHVPLLYLSFNLTYSLVSFPAGIISDRIGRRRVILTGFLLFGIIYWGFARSTEVWHIWVLFQAYGVFMGITEGIHRAYLGALVPENLKATGYGIFHTCVGLAVLPASIIAGYLWDTYGPHATFYFGTITAFSSAILFLIITLMDRKKGNG